MGRFSQVIEILRKGGVVAVPTDTVYGLVCDAGNAEAVRKIYELKRRPVDKPLVLFPHYSQDLEEIAEINEDARKLMENFWPGALTLVLRATGGAPELLVSRGKIGIRVPKHPLLVELLGELDFPLASTSANISGEPPLLSKEEVEKILGARVDYVIGEKALGQVPSTVIDVSSERPVVLRKGAIPVVEIERVLGKEISLGAGLDFHIVFLCTGNTCRSPMAEFILKHELEGEYSQRIKISSAGIAPPVGEDINPVAKKVLQEIDIYVPRHRAKPLTSAIIQSADLILGMEEIHVMTAKEMGAGSKVLLFGGEKVKRVEDPIGKSIETYRNVRDLIRRVLREIWIPYIRRKIAL